MVNRVLISFSSGSWYIRVVVHYHHGHKTTAIKLSINQSYDRLSLDPRLARLTCANESELLLSPHEADEMR